MRPLLPVVLVGFVAACATGETPGLDDTLPGSNLGGSGGDPVGSAGSFNQSGSTGDAGSFTTGGQFTTGGTFTQQGGFATAGTGFGQGGTGTAGTAAGGDSGSGGGGGAASGGKGGGGAGGTGGKAGTGGMAGTAPNGTCAQDPLGAKNTWTATASVSAMACATPDDTDPYCGPPGRGIDGVTTNRYATGTKRLGTEWYQIDFGKDVAVSKIVLNTAAGSGDYTLAYEVRMAADAQSIAGAGVIKSGTGQKGATTIDLGTPKVGRILRINQTMAMDGWWSLAEVDITCQ